MIRRNTRDTALARPEFHRALADFLQSGKATIGDASFGQTAWVWVKHQGNRYHLNADSTAAGVAAYLSLVETLGEDLQWSVVENARGRKNRAGFGPDEAVVEGFYLYRLV